MKTTDMQGTYRKTNWNLQIYRTPKGTIEKTFKYTGDPGDPQKEAQMKPIGTSQIYMTPSGTLEESVKYT